MKELPCTSCQEDLNGNCYFCKRNMPSPTPPQTDWKKELERQLDAWDIDGDGWRAIREALSLAHQAGKREGIELAKGAVVGERISTTPRTKDGEALYAGQAIMKDRILEKLGKIK